MPVIGALQCFYVELLHLQHGLHGPAGLFSIRVTDHLRQDGRNNLPGKPIFVFEPAALLRPFITTFRELLPVIVHFLLRLTAHLKRDCLVEFEHRAAIERGKRLSIEFKGHGQHASRRSSVDFVSGFSVPTDASDLRVTKDRGVELLRLFGMIINP